jgi:hypothetical protein
MRQEDMIVKPHSFSLAPFEVRCLPYFHGLYSLYILTANGVPIRRQISYPEVADGWIGLAFTITNHDKSLLPEEAAKLSEFKSSLREDHGHIGAYGGPRTSIISKHYVFTIKPKRTDP